MQKPIIGVLPLWDAEKDSLWMHPDYMDCIQKAGGSPFILPLTANISVLSPLLAHCDGLLFTGGQDVSSGLYGEEPHPTAETCPQRDAMETIVLQYAMEQDLPVLGICRGLQFINVFFGGTLWQDLPTQYSSEVEHCMLPPYNRRAHDVRVLPDTPLSDLLGKDLVSVNSCHHQGINTLAPGAEAMAVSTDDLIEAIRIPSKKFLWAVQWHPEHTYKENEDSRKIFDAFVKAATKE